MAGSLSNYAEDQIARFVFTDGTVVRPASRYVAFHSGPPGENGLNGEQLTRTHMTFGAPDSEAKSSSNHDLTITHSGSMITLNHWSLWTSANRGAGKCLGWGTLATAIRIGNALPVFGGGDKPQLNIPQNRTIDAGGLYCVARGLSLFGRQLALNWLLRSVAVIRPTAWYMALHYKPPTDVGVGGELATAGCSRQPLHLTLPTNGVMVNNSDITFGPAVGSWPRITHYSIWDAVTGGNCLMTRAFAEFYDIVNGDRLAFLAGDAKVTVN